MYIVNVMEDIYKCVYVDRTKIVDCVGMRYRYELVILVQIGCTITLKYDWVNKD